MFPRSFTFAFRRASDLQRYEALPPNFRGSAVGNAPAEVFQLFSQHAAAHRNPLTKCRALFLKPKDGVFIQLREPVHIHDNQVRLRPREQRSLLRKQPIRPCGVETRQACPCMYPAGGLSSNASIGGENPERPYSCQTICPRGEYSFPRGLCHNPSKRFFVFILFFKGFGR